MIPDDTPVVVAAYRTPIGTAGGSLREHTVDALAAPVLAALAKEADTRIDDVLLGNVFGPGGNPARVAALAAGLGDTVPGMTLDRQCASGLAAIVAAATAIRAGDGAAYLAGGVESPSTAPARTRPDGTTYTRAPFAPAGHPDPDMGPAADAVAARSGITRERQDAFAARSHARAVAAQLAGRFAGEIVPVGTADGDERPRDRFTPERLARFRPAFTPDGTHTAANSCGVNDGAAAVLLVSEARRRALGVPGLALEAAATRGCAPEWLGLGAVPAICALPGDPPDAVEFTEAFAGQVLACLDATGVDEHAVSPDGGAIALGHPWGASGAVLVVRLFHRLVVQGHGTTGLAALSSGGGLGVATRWRVVR
ncbi:thiolase family protein [Pseudonocardia sp. C8]|uniref:thiolase family protein n=1 Tax=Pseudonocardia sp. C8 TaxID=2762759 RepID=UPI001C92FB4D